MHYTFKISYSDNFAYSTLIACDSDERAITKALNLLGGEAGTLVSAFLYRVSDLGPQPTEELIGNFQFDHEDGRFIFLPA